MSSKRACAARSNREQNSELETCSRALGRHFPEPRSQQIDRPLRRASATPRRRPLLAER